MYLDSNIGTSLESNWLDGIRIAKMLHVNVKFTFNDELYFCSPETKTTDKPYLFSTKAKAILKTIAKS